MQAVEAIERATVAGVGPIELAEIGGWLVPLDASPINRGRSAVPLTHDVCPDAIAEIEAAFVGRGLPPMFRVADAPGLEPVRQALAARGYVERLPTMVMTAPAEVVAAFATPGEVLARPDASWTAAFAGEGFDPDNSARRVEAFARAADTAFGAVREGERTVAVGVAGFAHGWASISGMRTAPDRRRRGLAGRVLAAIAAAARARDVADLALQVECDNPPAISLYRRAGFVDAWKYRYWSSPK